VEPYLSPLSVNLIEPGLKATGRITLFPCNTITTERYDVRDTISYTHTLLCTSRAVNRTRECDNRALPKQTDTPTYEHFPSMFPRASGKPSRKHVSNNWTRFVTGKLSESTRSELLYSVKTISDFNLLTDLLLHTLNNPNFN